MSACEGDQVKNYDKPERSLTFFTLKNSQGSVVCHAQDGGNVHDKKWWQASVIESGHQATWMGVGHSSTTTITVHCDRSVNKLESSVNWRAVSLINLVSSFVPYLIKGFCSLIWNNKPPKRSRYLPRHMFFFNRKADHSVYFKLIVINKCDEYGWWGAVCYKLGCNN